MKSAVEIERVRENVRQALERLSLWCTARAGSAWGLAIASVVVTWAVTGPLSLSDSHPRGQLCKWPPNREI